MAFTDVMIVVVAYLCDTTANDVLPFCVMILGGMCSVVTSVASMLTIYVLRNGEQVSFLLRKNSFPNNICQLPPNDNVPIPTGTN